jgi:DNA-binding transcriptional MocR family regulator
MSSFTKLIAPGVRTGFMIGEPGLMAKVAKVAEDTYISPGYVAQGITNEWCRRGLLAPQIERLKALYGPRLDACLAALDTYMPDAVPTRPDGGFFISLMFPEGVKTTAVRAEAAKRALNLADGLAFFPEGGGERFLRLPFCALSPAEIDEGIRRLAESVQAVRQRRCASKPPRGRRAHCRERTALLPRSAGRTAPKVRCGNVLHSLRCWPLELPGVDRRLHR